MVARRQGPGLGRARAFPGGNVAELLPAPRPRPGDSRDLGRGGARLPPSPVRTCTCVVLSGEGTSRAGRTTVVARAERKCRAGRGSRRRRVAHPFRFQHFFFFRQRRRLRAQCESSGRAGHVTRPRRRVGFPLETSTLRSARPRSPPQEAASARPPLPEEALPLCTLAVCCSSTFGLLRPLYSRLWVRLRLLSAPPTSQIPTSFSTV